MYICIELRGGTNSKRRIIPKLPHPKENYQEHKDSPGHRL